MEDGTSPKSLAPMTKVIEVAPEAETLPLSTAVYAADPSAHLFEGRIYVYCSHDSPTVVQGLEVPHFNMVDYVVLSRDARGGGPTAVHADVLKLEDVPWASGKLWAPDAAYKDGTYYLFLPAQDRPKVFRIGSPPSTNHILNLIVLTRPPGRLSNWRRHLALTLTFHPHQDRSNGTNGVFRIGVATAPRPAGPFIAQPQPLAGSYSIDPAVFCDAKARPAWSISPCWQRPRQSRPPTARGALAHCVRRPSGPQCRAWGPGTAATPL